MSYTLSSLDDGHIILMTEGSDFDAHTEINALVRKLNTMLNESTDPVVVIFDEEAHVKSDMPAVGKLVHSEEGCTLISHPKLVRLMTVTSNRITQLTLKSINSALFGFADFSICPSLDEATDYARHLLHQKSKPHYGQVKAS